MIDHGAVFEGCEGNIGPGREVCEMLGAEHHDIATAIATIALCAAVVWIVVRASIMRSDRIRSPLLRRWLPILLLCVVIALAAINLTGPMVRPHMVGEVYSSAEDRAQIAGISGAFMLFVVGCLSIVLIRWPVGLGLAAFAAWDLVATFMIYAD